MSLFVPVEMTCPECGATARAQLAASVNADRRPDLRAAILAGTFQATACTGCGTALRFPAHLTYIDMRRSQWFLVEDASRLEDWRAAEAEAAELYDQSFGPTAPEVQRSLMTGVRARLVFGWPALREKLIAGDAGVADDVLELLKISILRNVPAPPLGDATELRLVSADEERLRFTWFVSRTEEQLTSLVVPRDIYSELAANLGPWAELRHDVTAGLFVDLKRLVFA